MLKHLQEPRPGKPCSYLRCSHAGAINFCRIEAANLRFAMDMVFVPQPLNSTIKVMSPPRSLPGHPDGTPGDTLIQKLVIANLPGDVTVADVIALVGDDGISDPDVVLNSEGNATKVTAVVTIDDIDRPAITRVAYRISGSRYRNRTLSAYVPLFM